MKALIVLMCFLGNLVVKGDPKNGIYGTSQNTNLGILHDSATIKVVFTIPQSNSVLQLKTFDFDSIKLVSNSTSRSFKRVLRGRDFQEFPNIELNQVREVTLHVYNTNRSTQVPFDLVSKEQSSSKIKGKFLFFFFSYGILTLALLCGALLYFWIRNAAYLYYTFFVFFMLNYYLWDNGIYYQYQILPLYLAERIHFVSTSMAPVCVFMFLDNAVGLKSPSKYAYIFLKISAYLLSIQSFIVLCIPFETSLVFWFQKTRLFLMQIIALLSLGILVIVAYKKKDLSVWVLVVGFFVFVLGTVLKINLQNGYLSYSFITANSAQIGSMVEIIVFQFFIFHQINMINRERIDFLNNNITLKEEKAHIAKELVLVQENERRQLAAHIHDQIGGDLATLGLMVSRLPKKDNQADELVTKIYNEIRHISHDQIPPDFVKLPLFQIIDEYVENAKPYYSFNIVLCCQGDENSIESIVKVNIYRILQEIINNVHKHAKASQVDISLYFEKNEFRLTVEDDGIGFKPNLQNTGIGLTNINNRIKYLNGLFHVDSNSDGTTIIIIIPIKQSHENHHSG